MTSWLLRATMLLGAAVLVGCASSAPTLRVAGDRPADVYVYTPEEGLREAITEKVREKLDLGSSYRYVGRTTPDGPARYQLDVELPERPEGQMLVRIESADGTWEYWVDGEKPGELAVVYPPLRAGVPPPTEPREAPPAPAGSRRLQGSGAVEGSSGSMEGGSRSGSPGP